MSEVSHLKMSPDRRLLARQERRHRRGCGAAQLVGQALAIDAEVLAYPLNVVARFVEGNALDPVDKISAAGSRITVRRDPLHHPAAAERLLRRELAKAYEPPSSSTQDPGRGRPRRAGVLKAGSTRRCA